MDLSKSQLKTLLLIYAANVDYKYSALEEKFIKDQCQTTDEFNQAMELFNENSEATVFTWIMASFNQHFESREEKQFLALELLELFQSDGDYCQFEQSFMNFFNLLVDKTSVE